jgi:hypothetical protein
MDNADDVQPRSLLPNVATTSALPPRGPHSSNFTEPLDNADDDRSPTWTPLAAQVIF